MPADMQIVNFRRGSGAASAGGAAAEEEAAAAVAATASVAAPAERKVRRVSIACGTRGLLLALEAERRGLLWLWLLFRPRHCTARPGRLWRWPAAIAARTGGGAAAAQP